MSRRNQRGRRRVAGRSDLPDNIRRGNDLVEQNVICDSGHDSVRVASLSLYAFDDDLTLGPIGGTWVEEQRPDGGFDIRFWCPRADCEEARLTPAEPLEHRLRQEKVPGTRQSLPPIRLRDL